MNGKSRLVNGQRN